MKPYVRTSPYTGPVNAVVLDWAGTAVDFGSVGPVAVFVEAFGLHGVSVSTAEARKPMGLMKRDHIVAMLNDPAVLEKWKQATGKVPAESDIDTIYQDVERLMIDCIARHSDPIPGLLETIEVLRAQSIKIGSCTGYTRAMMDILEPAAARKGYTPDAVVTSTDVPRGRPFPYMCFANAVMLETYPIESMIKIGDSISDIHEGLNAGMWTIGLTKSGNEMGLSLDELEQMTQDNLTARLKDNERRFMESGAHYTAETIADVLPGIEDIQSRLSKGETPPHQIQV